MIKINSEPDGNARSEKGKTGRSSIFPPSEITF